MDLKVAVKQRILAGKITLSRKLETPGKILVKAGDKVRPEDVVAYGLRTSGFRSIPLAASLGIRPSHAGKFLKVKVGDRVFPGEIIATRRQLFGKIDVSSPVEGTMGEYNSETGFLKIEFVTKRQRLTAGCWGKIKKTVNNLGVEIETEVLKTVGVAGSGRVREGQLKILVDHSDFLLPKLITSELAGKIIFGGARITKAALARALSLGVAGIIAGGIHVDDFFTAGGGKTAPYWVSSDVGITLVILEGFGLRPVPKEVFEVLKDCEEKFSIIDGDDAQLIIPQVTKTTGKLTKISKSTEKVLKEKVLAIGDKVRITDPSYLGLTGQVLKISDKKKLTKIGLPAYLVEVAVESGKIVQPYTNLEVLI